jgi:hypothetical protein
VILSLRPHICGISWRRSFVTEGTIELTRSGHSLNSTFRLFVAALMLPCRAFRPWTDIRVCSSEIYTDLLKLATDGGGVELIDDPEAGVDFFEFEPQ